LPAYTIAPLFSPLILNQYSIPVKNLSVMVYHEIHNGLK
jgi:hypothetical protein